MARKSRGGSVSQSVASSAPGCKPGVSRSPIAIKTSPLDSISSSWQPSWLKFWDVLDLTFRVIGMQLSPLRENVPWEKELWERKVSKESFWDLLRRLGDCYEADMQLPRTACSFDVG